MVDVKALFTKIMTRGVFKDSNGDVELSGALTLSADPVQNMGAATKQYVDSHGVKITTVSRTFVAQSAGARSYFQVTWASELPNTPFSIVVHTGSIAAISGTQFTPVNVSTTGAYISYYCPAATTQATLTIRAYYHV